MKPAPTDGAAWVERLAAEYGRGRPLALLFDYDGTLTPIVRHPSLARLTADDRHRLRRLTDLPDVHLGVISGRALDEVRSLVGVDGAYYAGSGGLEIDLLGSVERCGRGQTVEAILSDIESELLDLLRRYAGTWLERKPGAFALHYRGLPPLTAVCFRFEAVELLAVVEEFRVQVVSEAIEVTPADGWDKGSAVVSILEDIGLRVGSLPLPVYVGDAANDAEGMAVAAHAGGLSVGIGADAPAHAQVRLADVAELSAMVERLTDRLCAARRLPVPAAVAVAAPPAGVVEQRPDGPGLLIVDPDPTARERLGTELAALGWRIWQAADPAAAVNRLDEGGEDIRAVLVDLQLPGLQGARTLTEIGHGYPTVARFGMSAEVSPYTAVAFARMSDVPLLVKPFPAQELDAVLKARLTRAGGGH